MTNRNRTIANYTPQCVTNFVKLEISIKHCPRNANLLNFAWTKTS